jgi:hypothetical protein
MFHDWGEFYLLAGSAAAVLIGLIFVVVTLMQDKPRSTMLAGSRLYMGPVVLQVSFVLVLSAAALVPHIRPGEYAAITAVVALWGLYRGLVSTVGIRKLKWVEDPPHWTDGWFYGVFPTILSLGVGEVAWAFWTGEPWAVDGIAVVITANLLLAIRNEWDLVTWLAPMGVEVERAVTK